MKLAALLLIITLLGCSAGADSDSCETETEPLGGFGPDTSASTGGQASEGGSPPEGSGCRYNSDCLPEEFCLVEFQGIQVGQCQSRGEPGSVCLTDDWCQDVLECAGHTCAHRWVCDSGNEQCGQTHYCDNESTPAAAAPSPSTTSKASAAIITPS